MLTKIDICSIALLKLGEKPIQSFNDDSSAAQVARTLFETAIDSLLASHPWKFAQKKFTLSKTSEGDFLLPVEVLRVLDCDCLLYQISGNRLTAPADKVSISAIVRVGAESYPPYFANVAALALAREFCMPLIGDQNLLRTIAALFESELRAAKFIDSTMTAGSDIPDFSLISTRY
ncbi:MAG: hypothetical protein FWF97_03045 [Alphaproteobacteria bacterium]|nr:hypothetical protein [Alphaproteobacteria bacterium]